MRTIIWANDRFVDTHAESFKRKRATCPADNSFDEEKSCERRYNYALHAGLGPQARFQLPLPETRCTTRLILSFLRR
ncbi:hypothetical protein RB3746 [Rhodopirellula baltica SH 1]|uniref:Uncharacterized protein n=1 Tax=Rhodopirellula baltica (strain DSM 10527 / NCIMB 13988 / SH1) TaxID=243090 RepID=Q7UTQ2_RHOBA|nr:hypothetical protein RB3746 [Rhodopirellula baltica SH 1]